MADQGSVRWRAAHAGCRGGSGQATKRGIIDPVKVVRIALENAVSIAGTLLLAEATLTEVEDDAEKKPPDELDGR